MEPDALFRQEVNKGIQEMGNDRRLRSLSLRWLSRAAASRYSYNFAWLGRPIIQVPQDIVAMQELIWDVRPDLIIETGIAHGGSLILSASILSLIDLCEAIETGAPFDPLMTRRRVVGVDIDIRQHNRQAIESHPMASRIHMIQGSSVDPVIVDQVRDIAMTHQKVLVCLDSNHTQEHVLAELSAYGPLTSKNSYCVVFDSLIEDLPKKLFKDRPWGPGNNPKTAVRIFLDEHPEFVVDKNIEQKLQITVAPEGYLKRVE